MYDVFDLYDYILDRQTADEMGFETVQDLYEFMSKQRMEVLNERISKSVASIRN